MNKPDQLEEQLKEALRRLEKATERVMATQGYVNDVKQMRLLIELIKEQAGHENSLSTTSAVR